VAIDYERHVQLLALHNDGDRSYGAKWPMVDTTGRSM
jgi:hypothetical protein